MRTQGWRMVALGVLMLVLPAAAVGRQEQSQTAAQRAAALNAEYKAASDARDWNRAVEAARRLVYLEASAENLRLLATAQGYAGAKDDSLATYNRALAKGQAEKPADEQAQKAWKEEMAKIYMGKGNALLRLRRSSEAVEAYNHAAEFAADPGQAYFNVCATLYNTGDMADAPAACRRATVASPERADGWFILGSVLFVDAKADKSGKFLISAETRHALEKYLELAPAGPHAGDAREMLEMSAR